jgi:hypothetical protein
MRKTGKGSNNNAAQAEYVRLAALSYSLKSLKSSSYRFVFARPAQVQRPGCGGWSRQGRKRATGTCLRRRTRRALQAQKTGHDRFRLG